MVQEKEKEKKVSQGSGKKQQNEEYILSDLHKWPFVLWLL